MWTFAGGRIEREREGGGGGSYNHCRVMKL